MTCTPYKLHLVVIQASLQFPKPENYILIRVSRRSFTARTKKVSAEPTCKWDELIEIPEIRIGEELIAEVWDGTICSGHTRIRIVEPVQNSKYTEFILQSPSSREYAGIVSLGFQFTSQNIDPSSNTQTFKLFGVSLAGLLSHQARLGIELQIPSFLAVASQAILDNCLYVRGGFAPLTQFDEDDFLMFKARINSETSLNFDATPCHYILRILADWIAALPEPLIGVHNYDYLLGQLRGLSSFSPDIAKSLLVSAIHNLQDFERHTLAAFCALCEQVAQNSPFNHSPADKIATHLGKYLLWTRHPQTNEPIQIADDLAIIELLTTTLIQDWKQLFPHSFATTYPLHLKFKTLIPDNPITFIFRYILVASPDPGCIRTLSKVISRSQRYVAVSSGSEVRFLNMQTHLFDSSFSLHEWTERSAPPSPVALAHPDDNTHSHCIGLWEIGRTPISVALKAQSTWVIAFDLAVFALPTETSVMIRPIDFPGPFSCGVVTSVGLLLGKFDGTVVMLDLSTFEWNVVFDPSPTSLQVNPVVLLSDHIRDTNAVWVFFADGRFGVISLGMSIDLTPMLHHLSTPDGESPNVLASIVVEGEIWISTGGGYLLSYDVSTLKLIHQYRDSVNRTCMTMLNEDYVIVGTADGRAQIWNTKNFVCCGEIIALSDPIISVVLAKPGAFSSDICIWIASTKAISIWNLVFLE